MRPVESNSSLDTLNFKIRQLSIINEQESELLKKQERESECSPMLASPMVGGARKSSNNQLL